MSLRRRIPRSRCHSPIFPSTALGRCAYRPDQRQVGNQPDPNRTHGERYRYFSFRKPEHIVMVEGGAQTVPEDEILEALFAGHHAIQPLLQIQEQIAPRARQGQNEKCRSPNSTMKVVRRVDELGRGETQAGSWRFAEKLERYKRIARLRAKSRRKRWPSSPTSKNISGRLPRSQTMSFAIWPIHQERRIDGRGLKDIRPITCEVVSCRARTARRVHPRETQAWSSRPWERRRMSSGRA